MKRRIEVRDLLAALVADPYRKLFAIGLAVLLWFFINGKIVGEVTRIVSLTCIGSGQSTTQGASQGLGRLWVLLPTDRVIGRRFMDGENEIQTVRVTLRGSRFAIDALGDRVLNLGISKFRDRDWTTRREVEFTAADIEPDVDLQNLNIESIELEPSRIRLEVERIGDKLIKLGPDTVEFDVPDEDTKRRLRFDTAEWLPPQARILGPASNMLQLEQVEKPLIARVRKVLAERQVTATLELNLDKSRDLRFAETPQVTIQVLPLLETFQFELPIAVDDMALPPEQRGFRPDQKTRLVRIKVGGQLRTQLLTFSDPIKRQDWAAANLRLLVYVPRPDPGAPYGNETVQEAKLFVFESAQMTVDHNERLLDESVSVTLRRQ